jgi:hypothetical protein
MAVHVLSLHSYSVRVVMHSAIEFPRCYCLLVVKGRVKGVLAASATSGEHHNNVLSAAATSAAEVCPADEVRPSGQLCHPLPYHLLH